MPKTEPITFTVTVLDLSGHPRPKVRVEIFDYTGWKILPGITDAFGELSGPALSQVAKVRIEGSEEHTLSQHARLVFDKHQAATVQSRY